jgi:hypothetical protein
VSRSQERFGTGGYELIKVVHQPIQPLPGPKWFPAGAQGA